ncbi:MAG: hypothetical protein IAE82_10970 [Opitutaceae bacterium]|nr:hypothetical protein [Opitutaceae bacterium]
MKIRTILTLALAIASPLLAAAADLAGRWTSRFDSQIGEQNYIYVFASENGQLSGTATYEHSMGKGDVKLKDIKLDGEKVSFTETLDMGGNALVITYTGKVEGDTMTLTRQVGEFATEQITAKRTPPAKP